MPTHSSLATPEVPIAGGGRFPVRRIYCVGRNYAAHAREMGAPAREDPFFFMKPADAVHTPGQAIPFPPDTELLHHEVELVVAIGGEARDIGGAEALGVVFGYAVGLDLTKRDRQAHLKQHGQPWERAKSFDASAPISVIHPVATIGHPKSGLISLEVNGETRQAGDLDEMIWPVAELIGRLSAIWTLRAGDLIYTGTPDGVGELRRGDRLRAQIAGVGAVEFEMAP